MFKKLLPLLLCLVLLSGCTLNDTYQLEVEGYAFTVDAGKNTITHGENDYIYQINNPSIIMTTVTIYYPNGAIYKETYESMLMIGGSNSSAGSTESNGTYTGDFDESRYVPGPVLAKAANRANSLEEQRRENNKKDAAYLAVAVVLLVAGFLNLRFPEELWYWEHWWCVDGGGPSDMYLSSCRFGGVIFLVIGGVLLLMAIF